MFGTKRETDNCTKTWCMKMVDGKCVHNKCPLTNPDYEMPHNVAKRIEAETILRNKLAREAEKETKKSKKYKEDVC